jgi:solute carrier family 25 phosphate transporter 3
MGFTNILRKSQLGLFLIIQERDQTYDRSHVDDPLITLRYADAVGPANAVKYKDAIYLAGSASAELIADAAYVPLEAVKVRMQTTIPPFANGMMDGFRKFVAVEGTGGLYKSLGSLWSRQIPYTMMKFWSFEATVTKIYASLGKPKDSYNKASFHT